MIAQHPNPCEHEYQDSVYGRGYRVMNPVRDAVTGKLAGARCTVCCPPKTKMVKRGGVFALADLKMKTPRGP